MKTLITCDDAFEKLTAGPIELSAGGNAALREHLNSCDSCRDLAEALRPACHVLHESLPSEQRRGLPTVLSGHDAHVRQIMNQVRAAPITKQARCHWLGMAAGLALSACLMILFIPWGNSIEGPRAAMDVNRALASLELSGACQLLHASEHANGTGPDVYASKSCDDCHRATDPLQAMTFVCCTECHASGSNSPVTIADKTQLLLACGSCH